jgi:hypothetical protein
MQWLLVKRNLPTVINRKIEITPFFVVKNEYSYENAAEYSAR